MAQLKKILLVDDDEDLREALSEQMVMTEDFDVFEAGNGSEAMARAKDSLYDMIILDVGLPDTDGRELCKLMRKQGVKSPILMLTGHDSDADTILGLDAGANDYVTKPFNGAELLARVKTHIEIKALRGLLPICSKCKSIRDDKGYWNKIEVYIQNHSETLFSHSICPDCVEQLYGKQDWFIPPEEKG